MPGLLTVITEHDIKALATGTLDSERAQDVRRVVESDDRAKTVYRAARHAQAGRKSTPDRETTMTEDLGKTEVRQGDKRLMNARVLIVSAGLVAAVGLIGLIYASM